MSPRCNRRDFLKTASLATLSALAAGAPRELRAEKLERIEPTADCVILLWMAGGMAHTETFDPKAYQPYRAGMKSSEVLSTFPAIDTAVDPIKISQGLEHLAGVMDRATLIRSYTAGDLGFILHARHQFQWHTGYAPPTTVAAPHLGAVIARTLGPRNPAVPAFIDIGQRFDLGEGEELKAFHTAGFLGSEFGPFIVTNPADAAASVRPPAGMSAGRFQRRDALYRRLLEQSPIGRYGSDYQQQSLLRSMDNAHRLLSSPAAQAFDLTREPVEKIRQYFPAYAPGDRFDVAPDRFGAQYERQMSGRFGLGCLLARRMAEVGARFIEVTTEYIPFMNWDTHENGHTRIAAMKQQVDAPIAQLVLDLEERGMLDRTLIVVASEFSRDMMVEGKPNLRVKEQVPQPDVINDVKYYGMHRHFTDAGSVVMFGGGVKQGYVHGRTADTRPCKTIENRVSLEDLQATIFRAVGISPRLSYDVEQRPFYVTKDGLGKPVNALFARG